MQVALLYKAPSFFQSNLSSVIDTSQVEFVSFDCYRDSNQHKLPDVFMVDALYMKWLVRNDRILCIDELLLLDDKQDFVRAAHEACFVQDKMYGLPVLGCALAHFSCSRLDSIHDLLGTKLGTNLFRKPIQLAMLYLKISGDHQQSKIHHEMVLQEDAIRFLQDLFKVKCSEDAEHRIGYTEEFTEAHEKMHPLLFSQDKQHLLYMNIAVIRKDIEPHKLPFALRLVKACASKEYQESLLKHHYYVATRKSVIEESAQRHDVFRVIRDIVCSDRAVPLLPDLCSHDTLTKLGERIFLLVSLVSVCDRE